MNGKRARSGGAVRLQLLGVTGVSRAAARHAAQAASNDASRRSCSSWTTVVPPSPSPRIAGATYHSLGEVASSPVWHEYRDGKIWIASSSAFAKVRAIVQNPAVSFCVQDPEPPYRYVAIRGTAVVHPDREAAHALDSRLAVLAKMRAMRAAGK